MIGVEKFGGGALRVSYDDGRKDWMLWPFEEGKSCERAFVTDSNSFWVYRRPGHNVIEAAVFDAMGRTCLKRARFVTTASLVTRNGSYLAFCSGPETGTPGGTTNQVAVYRTEDLTEIARIEDKRLVRQAFLYERQRNEILVGTVGGESPATWVVKLEGGKAQVSELEGGAIPHSLSGAAGFGDPLGRRVVTIGAERTPIEKKGVQTLYGIPVKIWNLDSLQVENTLVIENAPIEFSSKYAGQDRLPKGNEWRDKWERMVDAVNPENWDGELPAVAEEGAVVTPYQWQMATRRSFASDFIADIAWERDGRAFWVLFSAGYLRRVTIEGSVSPRYVVQRMATRPVMGKRRWRVRDFQFRQEPVSLQYFANGHLRVMTRHATPLMSLSEMMQHLEDGAAFQFDPRKFSLNGTLVHRLVSPILGPRIDGIYVSAWRDGFVPQSIADFELILDELDGRKVGVRGRVWRAIDRRKKAFLERTSQSNKKKPAPPKPAKPPQAKSVVDTKPSEAELKRNTRDVEEARKVARPAGSIHVEKFGYTSGGALRVEYVGRGEDWMFLPFRENDMKEFHILGNDRIVTVASGELALFDANKRERVARQRVGGNLKLHASANGEWVAFIGKVDGEKDSLTIFDGHDLREIFAMEEEGLNYTNPTYEREDGALIIGGMAPGPISVTYIVTFDDGAPEVEKHIGVKLPGSYNNYWPCPTGRRVLARVNEPIPNPEQPGGKSFGISVEISNLRSLEIERTVVLDQIQEDLRLAQDYGLDKWDRSFMPDPSLDAEKNRQIIELSRQWHSFVERNLRAIAWEPDGEAFWAAFAGGYIRRVGVDGSVSPRVIIERLWPSESTGNKTSDLREMEILPDGRIRIEFYPRGTTSTPTRYFVCFQPPAAEILAAAQGDDIRISESDDLLGEVLYGYPTTDEDLKARMKAFEERAQDAPIFLADMSAASCIDAIERLTAAIDEDPYELVCGYNFRPTFIYAEGTPEEKRMGEDVFFRHVAANAPEARDAIERLLHMWMDRVPLSAKHRNYYMNDETVALSHALKALITLDPSCYDTIRRYVTELDMEHDVIVKNEILPYFGQVNRWRDLDAIRLGIFCMLEKWCGGSDGAWTDPSMQKKVMETMGGREFAELLIRETERYFSPDEATFNRQAWNHNNVRNYLQECEMYNFRTAEAFDREAVAVINEYLQRTKAEG